MRILAIALIATLAVPAAAVAVPCGPGTLLDYIGLGSSGCTVGGVTFSDFLPLTIPAGATLIAPAAIGVAPLLGPADAGLAFDVGVAASAGEFLDTRFGFRVSDTLGGATLAMSGSSAAGDGGVSVLEELCLGAAFGGGGCVGVDLVPPLAVFAIEGLDQLSDAATFATTSLLGVIADVGVDGGPAGNAALDTVTLRFQAGGPSTPPAVSGPSPLVLLAAAAVAAWARRGATRQPGGSR